MYSALGIDTAFSYVADIWKSWPVTLICSFLAFFIALAFMFIIEKCTKIFAAIAIFGTLGALIAVSTWIFVLSYDYESPDNNWLYMKIYGGIGWGLAIAFVCLLCCFTGSLRVAIAVLEAAADFVTDTLRVLLVPVISFFVTFAWIVLWTVVALFIYSVGTISAGGVTSGTIKKVEWEPQTRYFWYYHYFALLWWTAMLIALAQFIIIVSCCTWYFSHGSETSGSASVSKALYWTFRYHYGSLAFGSLILALVWLVRMIFEYIKKKLMIASPS
jgi:choline transporter-like protein 2/4/5